MSRHELSSKVAHTDFWHSKQFNLADISTIYTDRNITKRSVKVMKRRIKIPGPDIALSLSNPNYHEGNQELLKVCKIIYALVFIHDATNVFQGKKFWSYNPSVSLIKLGGERIITNICMKTFSL